MGLVGKVCLLNRLEELDLGCVCMCVCWCMRVSWCMCKTRRRTSRSWSSRSTLWILGTALRSSGLVAGTFPQWAILPALPCFVETGSLTGLGNVRVGKYGSKIGLQAWAKDTVKRWEAPSHSYIHS